MAVTMAVTASYNLLLRALVSARVPSVLEPVGHTRNDDKRSDGMTLVLWSSGLSLVIWPIPATVNSAAAKKFRKYADIEARGHKFLSLAFETLGQPSTSSEEFICKLRAAI